MTSLLRVLCSLTLPAALSLPAFAQHQPRFEGSTDIGHPQQGASVFQAATGAYRVSGGGQDVWGAADDFRFTWVRFSGDGSITADVQVAQPATHAKAKGMLMFRQSLDPGSPYADIALHGDGHIDLQWRATPSGETKDADLPEHNTVRLRIERRGDRFTAYTITPGERQTADPLSISIPMQDPVYVGIGVCSHNTSALQTVTFSNIELRHETSTPDKAARR